MKEPKMLFGFCLLGAIFALAMVIGLGHVEEKTSFGLESVLNILAVIGGAWANSVFGKRDNP